MAPPAWVSGVRDRALSHPRVPALWAGCRGPLPTGCGCGGVRAWGPVTNPTARALACCGGGMRVSGGGASCLGVGRPGSGALPTPTARPLGGLPGPTTHWLWVRGGAGEKCHHRPHSARSCELALRTVGPARGRPGGAIPAWVWGVRSRALSHPRLPALWAGCRGPLPTGCGCGGLRAWGPVTSPTARALASWLCALWGRHEGARGGASCLGVGRPGSGPFPTSGARPLGGLPGPTTHWLWERGGAGVGTRHQPHSARSCEQALRAVGAARGRPGGAPPAWVWGVRCRALSRPDCPPSGRAAGAHWPLAVGAGGCGRGDPSQTPQGALLRARFARCGGGMRVPGGAPRAWSWGVRGRALSNPRLPALWASCRGPLPTGCGCGGVRAWGPVTNPSARPPASWLCALWGQHEGAQGGRLLPWCGASGVGRSPTPDCPPSGRLPGPTTHWLWVRGGADVGIRHQPHSARSCELALRAVGAA